jgi:hypothetical protein
LITEGLHVPVIPLLEVVLNSGGVEPAQNGAMGAKVGVNTGLDKIKPVNSCVVHPVTATSKSE